MDINNKVAVVTGGASGLGLAVAKSLIASGARVFLFDLNEEQGQQAVTALNSESATFVQVDVTSANAVEDVVAHVVVEAGSIEICVNCAGIAPAAKTVNRDGIAHPLDLYRSQSYW